MSSVIDQLSEAFARFPGIGPRQARRFVYHLLSQEGSTLSSLAQNILRLRKEIHRCTRCYRFYPPVENYQELCEQCRDASRDAGVLMVVAKDTDIDSIQKSHAFEGYYFVLGGLLSLVEKEPQTSIRSHDLLVRVGAEAAAGTLKEVILALSANTEGDHTTEYLQGMLAPLAEQHHLKISVLGRGLSTGTELEYSDSDTIKNALKNRQ